MTTLDRTWIGIDAGKGHHWAVAIDADGTKKLSRKVSNDEAEILALIAAAGDLADNVTWAVDISGRSSNLLITLLTGHGQHVVYVPGRTVNRMTSAYRGEGKTDAKDAFVIADQARMRRDFAPLKAPTEATVALDLLTKQRADLIADKVRLINRFRDLLLGIFPALERSFDYTAIGPLTLLSEYQTPAALRRLGVSRLEAWLKRRGVRNASTIAATAVEAAQAQHTSLPGEQHAAAMIAELAGQLLALLTRLKTLEADIAQTFRTDPRAEVIESLPGMGPILGAELVAIVGDLSGYRDAGRLASHAGLAPVPRDSGRKTGNNHRPQRYNRRLRYVFYLSAQSAMIRPGPSRTYYLKKRAQGLLHTQALLALARRRVDVLWAMIRDERPYSEATPPAPIAA